MSPEQFEKLKMARLGGRVERCHGIPHHGSYNNGSHTWGTLLILWYLWPNDFPEIAPYLLSHDVPEFAVGDIPAPTTRTIPGIKNELGGVEDKINRYCGLPALGDMRDEDFAKLKACDHLDFYMWCYEQLAMGNRYVENSIRELEHYWTHNPLPSPADELAKTIKEADIVGRQAGVMQKATGNSYGD